jgi:ppGpp synthetase/RelA/SpoT-type nucleotidyltranferase
LLNDLKEIDETHRARTGGALFTTVECRVKSELSFFRKLYGCSHALGQVNGVTPNTLATFYAGITDLCGARFACPYFDDVATAVNQIVRPALSKRGYAVDLRHDSQYFDKDYLDGGSDAGYRSYHFFIKIPTPIDIFGNVEHCLCEVQARTELQHVWAVKSHDLLYKPESGLDLSDQLVVKDMRAISDQLKAIDQLLISIRDRARNR